MRKHLSTADAIHAVVWACVAPPAVSINLFQELRRRELKVPLILVFDSASPEEIADAIKWGATSVLIKPVRKEALSSALRVSTGSGRGAPSVPQSAPSYFVGPSPSIQGLNSAARQIGSSEAPVLIQGETGVGKGALARRLHALSRRAGKPFLNVNCASLPAELIESELFGYNRGAFTGAVRTKPGMFELANTGFIVLDEIGDMDLRLQAKLLQVLQDQEFYRLGGTESIRVNVRVIATTHNDLERAVANGTFRADLYYRLSVITLRVPPLRDRREDIVPTARFLMERHVGPGTPAVSISSTLEDALVHYDWPGNVRELENVMWKLLIMRDPELIAAELKSRTSQVAMAHPTTPRLAEVDSTPVLEEISKAGDTAEAEAITAALEAARWNRKAAAYFLGIGYKALLYKMKKLNIADLEAPIALTAIRADARPADVPASAAIE